MEGGMVKGDVGFSVVVVVVVVDLCWDSLDGLVILTLSLRGKFLLCENDLLCVTGFLSLDDLVVTCCLLFSEYMVMARFRPLP
jgi:hypothetical protein